MSRPSDAAFTSRSRESPVLRGVFLGAGHFAAIQLEAWNAVPDVRIVGLYNRSVTRARELAGKFGIERVSGDIRELLESTRPDFVDVCTSVETHLEFARIAVDLGIPCFSVGERPMMFVLKSGSFGTPDFFEAALAHLKDR